MALIMVYGFASIFYNMASSSLTILWTTPLQWMFMALGVTWAFHLSFTCWMIPKGQSDLTFHGTFFSLVIIYLMNLLVLAVFLIVAAPEISFRSFGGELLENTENFSAAVWSLLTHLVPAAKSL